MPPRFCGRCIGLLGPRRSASTAAITPAPPVDFGQKSNAPIKRHPPTQPPSFKPPGLRKSQLHRQYTSLLRSTPLLVFFQHSNLQSIEWLSIRRELALALNKVDADHGTNLAQDVQMQVLQNTIFESALRVVEYYKEDDTALSTDAHRSVIKFKRQHALSPLLVGPLASVAFPELAPYHLKAVLQTLFPDKAAGLAAPTRRQSPGLYEPPVQKGVQKLMLLGAKVGPQIMDHVDVQQIGRLPDLKGLRGQVVAMLGSVGGQLVTSLESGSRSLWLTLESRHSDLNKQD